MLIGKALKKAREIKGVTQKQLAEMLYVDPSLVCRWEKGYKPISAAMLPKVLEFINNGIDKTKGI